MDFGLSAPLTIGSGFEIVFRRRNQSAPFHSPETPREGPQCPHCNNTGWVCENHSDRPRAASAVGCFLNCANTCIIRLLEDSASGTANKLQIQSISSAS